MSKYTLVQVIERDAEITAVSESYNALLNLAIELFNNYMEKYLETEEREKLHAAMDAIGQKDLEVIKDSYMNDDAEWGFTIQDNQTVNFWSNTGNTNYDLYIQLLPKEQ